MKKIKIDFVRYLLAFALLLCISPFSVSAITDPAIKYPGLDLYLKSPNLVREKPQRFVPRPHETAPENIDFWLSVLPFPEDRNENMYMVIPGLGLVTPIMTIPQGSLDYNNMLAGRDIPINNYLRNGIIEYVSSVPPGHEGKRIDFGHSNYFANDSGRYKTIFANLMRVDAGDEVWYYVKQTNGSYELFKYRVTASYPTNPSNVEALLWDGTGADALIFGCYFGLEGRWMVEATYLGTPRKSVREVTVLPELYPAVPAALEQRLSRAVGVMKRQSIDKRKYQIIVLFQGIQKARAGLRTSDPQFALKTQLLEMIEDKLAVIYPL